MKSEESTRKKNQGYRKEAKTVTLVFAVLIIAALIAIPLAKGIKKVIRDEEMEGYNTFNASRYFFRFDYPEEWPAEKETNGFLLDPESGLVCTVSPAETVKISFYYKDGGMSLEEALNDFQKRFAFNYGIPDKINVESEKTELLAEEISNDDVSGTMYIATRSMAHYAVVVTYGDEKEFKKCEEAVKDTVRSFRLSVFED